MKLFENGRGRPSNETLKKRKTFIAVIMLLVVTVLGAGGYYLYNTLNTKEISGKQKNALLISKYNGMTFMADFLSVNGRRLYKQDNTNTINKEVTDVYVVTKHKTYSIPYTLKNNNSFTVYYQIRVGLKEIETGTLQPNKSKTSIIKFDIPNENWQEIDITVSKSKDFRPGYEGNPDLVVFYEYWIEYNSNFSKIATYFLGDYDYEAKSDSSYFVKSDKIHINSQMYNPTIIKNYYSTFTYNGNKDSQQTYASTINSCKVLSKYEEASDEVNITKPVVYKVKIYNSKSACTKDKYGMISSNVVNERKLQLTPKNTK